MHDDCRQKHGLSDHRSFYALIWCTILAWKSGTVKFWTNIMSGYGEEIVEEHYLINEILRYYRQMAFAAKALTGRQQRMTLKSS